MSCDEFLILITVLFVGAVLVISHLNELIVGCVGGVATIASACVTYFKPKHAAKIVAAIGIVATAAVEVTNLFF